MRKMSVFSALGASFAIVAAVAIFLPWISDALLDATVTYRGWDVFQNTLFVEGYEYFFLPLVMSLLGIVSWLVFMFAPKGSVTKLLTVVIGIMITVLAVITFFTATDALGFTEMVIGWGMYVVMAAGILSAVCGAVACE